MTDLGKHCSKQGTLFWERNVKTAFCVFGRENRAGSHISMEALGAASVVPSPK